MHTTNRKPSVELSENKFKLLLPEHLQLISKIHFTPIHIAQLASQWLTEDGRKNILDIGAGVGKFCISGALVSDSYFYGIEMRTSLVKIAGELIDTFEIKNARVIEQNVLDTDFNTFDAFYLYNPFHENIAHHKRMNNEINLSEHLHRNYREYTRSQFQNSKKGTRIVSYHGEDDQIPTSFIPYKESANGLLKLWIRS